MQHLHDGEANGDLLELRGEGRRERERRTRLSQTSNKDI